MIELAAATVAAPLAVALVLAVAPSRFVTRTAVSLAPPVGALGLTLAVLAACHDPSTRHGVALDAAGSLLLAVTAAVGAASVLVSPASVAGSGRGRSYYLLLYVFWALLFAVPLTANLGAAWLLVEATTAPSALLVGFSRRRRALEAGWKYLILTSLGLGVALLGIVILASGVHGGLGGLSWHALATFSGGSQTALVAYLLLLCGLAAKIGWAPVHNWLPDAHSQAPPPVSALLSAALLPTVLLVAWRADHALGPVVGRRLAGNVLVAFGLASLAVAVPFLWRALAWKRLLAYSSLEHMGVLALGIGFGTPLALAGVALHVAGHAIAKALGFYAAEPLLRHEPRAAGHAVTGVARTDRRLGAALGLSLATLAGLPPSPLFASEVLIAAGGFESGHTFAAAAAVLLLALGFVGLMHSLIETTVGTPHRRVAGHAAGLRGVTAVLAAGMLLLAGLDGAAAWLPRSDFVHALVRGLA